MTTFTIDAENNITVFASKKDAAAASTAPFDAFASQSEFAELTADWPMQRVIEVWNGGPGVTPVAKFTSRKVAAERIWKAIQSLEAPAKPVPSVPETTAPESPAIEAQTEPVADDVATRVEAATPSAELVADAGAQAADVAPEAEQSQKQATRAKKAPKASQKAKAPKSEGPREGSKTSQVIAMMQRDGGATISEIMEKMGWQKHAVRSFMAGAMKKAGYTVESFKPEGGERSYRINK